ncbi:LysR family transcriptional regulator [Octadecabacter sp. CECT 8868]|uniref:LysR family transcriptional regulator n=1 Tax=Octadecabacter algicola TaxID=2909342 RepID=UPI001F3694ED|nr:LysR family transcriptional regulator [Octadecabacter algicola]MCF2904217.1 LysR family transcriptional regulator [Octadecabacter algicola]
MIDKLEMFIALAREEHFGRAANAQGVTQPTLSAAIKQLEDQLGVMLVWRGSRYRGLTPEGQRALDWARRIVGDARSLRQEMRVARQGLSGDLRLAVIPTALTVVSDLIAGYAEAHPNVRFSVQSNTSIEVLNMLENLEIDAGLTYLDNEPLGRVTTVPIYSERYVLVAKAGHPLLGGPVRWADLADVPLCLMTPDMQNRRIINQHLAKAGVEVTPQIEASSIVVLVSQVVNSNLATILPVRAAEIFLKGDDLGSVPLIKPDASHTVGLVAPQREPFTPVLATLLDRARALSAAVSN